MANNSVRAARQESIRSHNSRWEVDSSCRFTTKGLFLTVRVRKRSRVQERIYSIGCCHVGNKSNFFLSDRHDWHPDSCDILSLVRLVPPIPEMKGLALGTLIDLCVYSITYMNQCSWHLHPVKPHLSRNKETLKSTRTGGYYMVHHRLCVSCGTSKKIINRLCVHHRK